MRSLQEQKAHRGNKKLEIQKARLAEDVPSVEKVKSPTPSPAEKQQSPFPFFFYFFGIPFVILIIFLVLTSYFDW